MRTIWKFSIPTPDRLDGAFSLDMPEGAIVIMAGEQMAKPCIWAEVDSEKPLKPRSFCLVGTGFVVPDGYEHVATWQSVGGVFVLHLYERKA